MNDQRRSKGKKKESVTLFTQINESQAELFLAGAMVKSKVELVKLQWFNDQTFDYVGQIRWQVITNGAADPLCDVPRPSGGNVTHYD